MADELPEDFPRHCSICGRPFDHTPHSIYVNPVCDECDSRAVKEPGTPAGYENPVLIDCIQCFRRYKNEAWLTQRDTFDCDDYKEFYDKHYDDYGPIHTFNQPDPPPDGRDVRQLAGLSTLSGDEIIARALEGNILEVEADALLCGITTNPSLDGGVAGAVCDASDYALRPLVRDKAPIQLGDAVVTGGYDLPYSYLVFVAATPAEAGKDATKASVSEAIQSGLRQVAELRLPSVVLPLVGAGAGGLDADAAAAAIVSGIQTSGVSPPICVRIVGRNATARRAIDSALPDTSSPPTNEHDSDPLRGIVQTRFEQVHKPDNDDGEMNVSEWELYTWVRFDPFTGKISDYEQRGDTAQMTLEDAGPPEEAVDLIEDTMSRFGEDHILPEHWLAEFEDFNTYMGGIRAAIDHPKLNRPLYIYEQALVGMLRGLEHSDSEYDDVLELILETPARSPVEENIARLRYRIPPEIVEAKDDIAEVEDSWLRTASQTIYYTVESLSHLDFDHPMSDTLRVEHVDRIELVAHTYSRVAFELEIPMDIAEELAHTTPNPSVLADVVSKYRNHLE